MPSGYLASLPPEDIEYLHGHRLLGRPNNLDRRIMDELVGRPKHYGELKSLLDGNRGRNLAMALNRLQRDGLVEQRIDTSTRPPGKSYELSNLGVLVVLRMHEMIPAFVAAETLLRGQAASSA